MKKITGAIAIVFCSLIASRLIAAAYGGTINPAKSTIPSLLAMTFPFILPAVAILAVVFLFFKKIAAIILICALLICTPQICTYFPINPVKADGERSFTLMTYNVANLKDFATEGETSTNNPTLKFIIEQSPDIVALQECATFSITENSVVSTGLIDSLFTEYPHHTNGIEGQALLSRYPFEQISLHHKPGTNFQVRAYRMFIPTDTFTLINMHLKSIGLNSEDKTLYKDLTKGKTESEGIKQEIRDIRTGLISKLSEAFRVRATQSQLVKDLIDSIGGKIIVCGDFNDVPGCYSIRTIESSGLKDAYRHGAAGPAITFHEDRFFFRIDHILYSGFTPLEVKCITTPHSDHYPLIASFSEE